jgi:ring-1,2-phenylacetyl-CoA epoxidase subunit PaaC
VTAATEAPARTDAALVELALRMGDTALILGHRNSEWCGHAPALEEDIALANVALDLIGQTQLWLGLAGEVEGRGRTADDLAYLRDARDFRCALLVQLPNGDFGRTLTRQFLFDAWHLPTLRGLARSADPRVAAIGEKSAKEAAYHLERSADLVTHLGDGTAESRRRMQAALDALWPYAGELLAPDATDATLAEAGIAPDLADVARAWEATVAETLAAATLRRPEGGFMHDGAKRGRHTEHLGYVLAEMQFLQRAYPGARW